MLFILHHAGRGDGSEHVNSPSQDPALHEDQTMQKACRETCYLQRGHLRVGVCSRSLFPPFQAGPLHYLSPLPALYQVRGLQAPPSQLHLETAAETECRTDGTERPATIGKRTKGITRRCGTHRLLQAKGGSRESPERWAWCSLKPQQGWHRGEQQEEVPPGPLEERVPRGTEATAVPWRVS